MRDGFNTRCFKVEQNRGHVPEDCTYYDYISNVHRQVLIELTDDHLISTAQTNRSPLRIHMQEEFDKVGERSAELITEFVV